MIDEILVGKNLQCNIDLLKEFDKDIADAIELEVKRQNNNLELIASENIVSNFVLAAMGSVLTNKYAEGYPSRRYYGGCEYIDVVENLARDRAKKLFKAEHVNVQPHSGSQANMAVYFAFLKPGDTVLGMDLGHGGHLTHGSSVNISGTYYNFVSYGLDSKTEQLNYDVIYDLAVKHNPKLIIAGASAYARKIDFQKFRKIADVCNSYLMVDMAHIAGLVAAGLHESPIPYSDFVTSTTQKTLRGPRGGIIFCKNEYAQKIDKAIFPGIQGGPLMHIIAAKAVCFKEALKPEFKTYQKQVISNAFVLANELMNLGFNLVTNGTDNHLMLINLVNMNVTGKELECKLDEVNITVNKNAVPNDLKNPFITSGIRIGTPAVTTRGLGKQEMKKIANLIYKITTNFEKFKSSVKDDVANICNKHLLF